LKQAGCRLEQIDAVAVAHRPGLIGSLLIGVTAAKTLAWALGKPLLGVDHVHAHLYSVMLDESSPAPTFPCIGLVCSGGHTALYRMGDWLDVQLIGSTIDDAVGEAYDKVAAILGLAYPGGPILDALAGEGNPAALKLPRTLLSRDSLDFSFSGLKTAVLYHVRGVPNRRRPQAADKPPPTPEEIRDIAASFQAACIEVIVKKISRAAQRFAASSVIVGGGVSANRGLRAALAQFRLPVLFPKMAYCTDNAAMSAGLGHLLLQQGRVSALDLDAITYSQFRPALLPSAEKVGELKP
jgi:N6-L-threonylcarbamoyladenine synthase